MNSLPKKTTGSSPFCCIDFFTYPNGAGRILHE
jgi:hypothetical protein